jgi:hypothetical protein
LPISLASGHCTSTVEAYYATAREARSAAVYSIL